MLKLFSEWTGKDRLDINVDLTVAMPCDGIGADVLDSTNQNTFTYGRLREDPEWFELDHLQVTLHIKLIKGISALNLVRCWCLYFLQSCDRRLILRA